jgi:hypothetical protein
MEQLLPWRMERLVLVLVLVLVLSQSTSCDAGCCVYCCDGVFVCH